MIGIRTQNSALRMLIRDKWLREYIFHYFPISRIDPVIYSAFLTLPDRTFKIFSGAKICLERELEISRFGWSSEINDKRAFNFLIIFQPVASAPSLLAHPNFLEWSFQNFPLARKYPWKATEKSELQILGWKNRHGNMDFPFFPTSCMTLIIYGAF